VLASQTPAAHVVGTLQHRGRDPRGLGFAVHAPNGTGHLRQVSAKPRSWIGAVSTLDPMRIAIGGDHAGFPLKQHLVEVLEKSGSEVTDLGTDSTEPVDYPLYCAAVALAVVRGEADFGIVLGGSGQGEQISANKINGARAALCNDLYTARMARQHNNANVLSIGARIVAPELAEEILRIFLDTPFEGGRHQRRLDEITELERTQEVSR
jgi:ribose 5-phosphate isomerase B